MSLGLSLSLIGTITPSAFAEALPTMNQPDWGFYEGPNPEWATLHSTDDRGTEKHRQYHRDGAKAHLLWHEQNRPDGTVAYEEAHRLVHQERNAHHREFHTAPVLPLGSTSPARFVLDQTIYSFNDTSTAPSSTINTSANPSTSHTYDGEKPSRRSIIADAEEQNRLRTETQ